MAQMKLSLACRMFGTSSQDSMQLAFPAWMVPGLRGGAKLGEVTLSLVGLVPTCDCSTHACSNVTKALGLFIRSGRRQPGPRCTSETSGILCFVTKELDSDLPCDASGTLTP